MPERGYNLCSGQFVLIQDVHDHWVERETHTIGKAAQYINVHLEGGLFTVASASGSTNLYPVGKRYLSSNAGLFMETMTLGLGKYVLGPSWMSDRAGAPGETVPSATTSWAGSSRARLLFLSTTLLESLVSPS